MVAPSDCKWQCQGYDLLPPQCTALLAKEVVIMKAISRTRSSTRKIKTAGGGTKIVHVKAHTNRINRVSPGSSAVRSSKKKK
jgi:hypothetical protein